MYCCTPYNSQRFVPAVNLHWTRLDVIKHAITNFLHAKRWTSPAHRFGLISVQQVAKQHSIV
jgi:hypothetical protein